MLKNIVLGLVCVAALVGSPRRSSANDYDIDPSGADQDALDFIIDLLSDGWTQSGSIEGIAEFVKEGDNGVTHHVIVESAHDPLFWDEPSGGG